MKNEGTPLALRARFYSSITLIYGVILLFGLYVVNPRLFSAPVQAQPAGLLKAMVVAQTKPVRQIISGKPARIVIERLGIDLPVDDGRYDAATDTWSLSGYHAQYALGTSLANDTSGNTFIYGHNNKYVFGPLKGLVPGDLAYIYTANGRVFTYVFSSELLVTPDNTAALQPTKNSVLTVQTCGGSWNEQRRLFTFTYREVS